MFLNKGFCFSFSIFLDFTFVEMFWNLEHLESRWKLWTINYITPRMTVSCPFDPPSRHATDLHHYRQLGFIDETRGLDKEQASGSTM